MFDDKMNLENVQIERELMVRLVYAKYMQDGDFFKSRDAQSSQEESSQSQTFI
jgi:hypothetical protein